MSKEEGTNEEIKATRLSSEQVFLVLKALRPLLPIEYHARYEQDPVMRGMPQIILNGVQFLTPRHASMLSDTRFDAESEERYPEYALTLQNIEQRLAGLRRWTTHGNIHMTSGCDFCKCGGKYWVNDTCQSCGYVFNHYKHFVCEEPQVNVGDYFDRYMSLEYGLTYQQAEKQGLNQ